MSEPAPRRHPLAIAYRLLRLPLAAYLSVVLLMTFIERWLVYPAPPVDRANWSPRGDYEDVEFASADGTRLHGWFYPRDARRAPCSTATATARWSPTTTS